MLRHLKRRTTAGWSGCLGSLISVQTLGTAVLHLKPVVMRLRAFKRYNEHGESRVLWVKAVISGQLRLTMP